jgi:hypothetical protein
LALIIGSGNIGGNLGKHFEPDAPLYNQNLKIREAEKLLSQIK